MDLTTRYLGLDLSSPLLAGASPLTGDVGNIRQLEISVQARLCCPRSLKSRLNTRMS